MHDKYILFNLRNLELHISTLVTSVLPLNTIISNNWLRKWDINRYEEHIENLIFWKIYVNCCEMFYSFQFSLNAKLSCFSVSKGIVMWCNYNKPTQDKLRKPQILEKLQWIWRLLRLFQVCIISLIHLL